MKHVDRSNIERGFTVIEIMISMVLLAFIAFALYENTTQTFNLRENLERDGDFYNSIQVALETMRRDVVHLYTPQAEAMPGSTGATDGGQTPNLGTNVVAAIPFWKEPINALGTRPSRFSGERSKLKFISNSHIRIYSETRESDFARITYYLDENRLMKTEDPDVFSEQEFSEQMLEYTLLENVKSLKFQFLDGEKDQWHPSWDNDSSDHKDRFPIMVEVTLEIYLPDRGGKKAERESLAVLQRFRPELPL